MSWRDGGGGHAGRAGGGRRGRLRAGVQGRCPLGRHGDRRRRRPGLEGSRDYTLAGRLSLRPSVEVGLRHDAGDAETGAGLDIGSGLIISDPSTGLAVDVRVRMQEKVFRRVQVGGGEAGRGGSLGRRRGAAT